MSVFISTGGYKKISANNCISNFEKFGIKKIELSGGLFSENLISEIIKLKDFFKFQIHNYFPPHENSFVINLGSLNSEIEKKSLNHIKESIILANKIGATHYSFHAGFLIDPKPHQLGKKIEKSELFDRDKSKNKFFDNVSNISKFAQENNVQILVENNVLSHENLSNFKMNPTLLADPRETKEFLDYFKKSEVNLLLDVAHLKVSAKTLSFKVDEFFHICEGRVGGYHLSENDGYRDTNEPFNETSWFWEYLDKKLNYYTVEVYNQSPDILVKQRDIVEKKIS